MKRFRWTTPLLIIGCGVVSGGVGARAAAADLPDVPRIDSVVMADAQPHETDAAVIWYDDFDDEAQQRRYPERSGETTAEVRFGDQGRALQMDYPEGERGTGGRKLFFGDTPTHRAQAVRPQETFTDVYWRIYVRHQRGWTGGGPAKLSRATSLVPPGWRQAMIAHVWSSGEALTLDPASGVRGARVVTTRYNDFDNLRWLGNKPASQFQLHSREESGRWVCVEARAKLNTPGQRDGLNQLWIDGRLEAERRDLDWRGTFADRGINAVFLEAYWNNGSPVDQSRWIDNFVVSTQPIGPAFCPRNPVLIKTPDRGSNGPRSWEAEIAADSAGASVVWTSDPLRGTDRVRVGTDTGRFIGSLAGEDQLDAARTYFVRARQQSETGQRSAWSPWHQPFQTLTGPETRSPK
ncbi:hypothetical protein [Alienimonas chondri]|uniref:Uncharacterized protein n=1 Tax=Alienimonas chondri TaxID=2681879 RepID=A0ABX1VE77_9PLAN|nr:hypothetical protein [Alienimonas chondri]NNJ26369.1 hypothetical protein [Alienimonas chondri]